MPKPNGRTWRHCRARMDITSDQAAVLLNISGGALRQIENEVKPVSLRLAYRAARLYKVDITSLVSEDDEPAPEPTPPAKPDPEPKIEPTHPPGRRNGRDGRTGPRRNDMQAAS